MNNTSAETDDETKLREALAESQKRELEFSALLEASRTILEYRDFSQAAKRIFDSCKNLIGATAGYVALLSEDGTENLVLFLDAGGRTCTVDPSLPMPIRGLRGEAYGAPKTVYENNFPSSPWVKLMPEGHVRLDNVLFAPLLIGGKAVGVMGIANKPGGFTDRDARIATAFGDIAALSLSATTGLWTNLQRVMQRSKNLMRNLAVMLPILRPPTRNWKPFHIRCRMICARRCAQ